MKTDHSDLTIEDEALLDDINKYERAATKHRRDATGYRTTARSWRDFPVGDPVEAETFADINDAQATRSSVFEGNFLGYLNTVLLGSGHKPGETWDINDSVYRVVTLGNPCVRLGSSIPKDEPDTDPDWSDRDEYRERVVHFGEMMRVGQP